MFIFKRVVTALCAVSMPLMAADAVPFMIGTDAGMGGTFGNGSVFTDLPMPGQVQSWSRDPLSGLPRKGYDASANMPYLAWHYTPAALLYDRVLVEGGVMPPVRVSALQGLIYDPARPLADFKVSEVISMVRGWHADAGFKINKRLWAMGGITESKIIEGRGVNDARTGRRSGVATIQGKLYRFGALVPLFTHHGSKMADASQKVSLEIAGVTTDGSYFGLGANQQNGSSRKRRSFGMFLELHVMAFQRVH